MASTPPLQGLRIVEASSLGPAALTMPWSTWAPR